MIPSRVTLVEVGPRDGLQNEKEPVGTDDKVELVHRLQAAGLREIEVTSFVSPKWVPQMADNAQVMAAIRREAGVRYSVLTPNLKGFEAALPSQARRDRGVRRRHRGLQPAQHQLLDRREHRALRAGGGRGARSRHQGARRGVVRARLPVPGRGVAPTRSSTWCACSRSIGVQHVGIADTIGVGTPRKVQAAMERALEHYPLAEVSGHFHDTYGQALSNIYACLEIGVHTFDASVAGLGGCPYAKGATGNVATEDVVFMLDGLGIETGIDLDALVDAGAFISERLGRPPVSRVGRALLAKRGKVFV